MKSINRRTAIAATSAAVGLGMGASVQGQGRPTVPVPVAFLMDDRATMIDFAGPWEAFQDAVVADVPGFDLYTVTREDREYRTTGGRTGGMRFLPDHTLSTAPQPKIIVMGAQAGMNHPEKLEWIREMAPRCDVVLSVCTGAFMLARTGLLDGLEATTHHDFYESFATSFPTVTLVRGRRFVDNGKFITAGGLTSGVDGALHVVERIYGEDAAAVSARYMEHYGDGWRTGALAPFSGSSE